MIPVTLRFEDRDLEREFEEEYYARTLIQARWAIIVGVALYSVYGMADFWLAPGAAPADLGDPLPHSSAGGSGVPRFHVHQAFQEIPRAGAERRHRGGFWALWR